MHIRANGGPIVEEMQFPKASGYLEVPAANGDIQAAVTESGTVALDVPGMSSPRARCTR